MKLFKFSTLFLLGLTLSAVLTSLTRSKKVAGVDKTGQLPYRNEGASTLSRGELSESNESNPHLHKPHQDGDARNDKEELKKNQARLHVSANHKTVEMERLGRGTFP